MLTEQQKQEIDIRLEQTWTGSRACPICGRENWNRLDMVFEQKVAEKFEDDHDAPTLPLIHLSCYTCGYVLSFNAITLKLIHPLLQNAEEGDGHEVPHIEHISNVLKLEADRIEAVRHESILPEPESSPKKNLRSKHDAHILEMHLDSLMNQSVNFMILGGLISLIALGNGSNEFMHIYLSKTVWYFLAAIFVYFFTSSKEYARDMSNLLGTHKRVAQARKALETGKEQSGEEHAPNVSRAYKLLAANKILIMLFIITFIVHFYIFILSKPPFSPREEFLLNTALIACGIAAYKFMEKRS
jgi:hypothetical protein